MTPREQRTIGVWGGGALAVVVIGWIALDVRGDGIERRGRTADQLHDRYETFYVEDRDRRLPADRALADLATAAERQEAELAAVERRCLWPGQGPAPREFAGFDFAAPINYNDAQDKVRQVNARLRTEAARLAVELPRELPFEAEGQLDNEDEARRRLQMAQLCAYAAMVDLCLEAGAVTIAGIAFPGQPWRDGAGRYAAVPVALQAVGDYACTEQIMRRLRDDRRGLGLDELAIDFQDDGTFRCAVTAFLLVPGDEAWGLSERATDGRGARGAGGSRPTRGATRGVRRGVR